MGLGGVDLVRQQVVFQSVELVRSRLASATRCTNIDGRDVTLVRGLQSAFLSKRSLVSTTVVDLPAGPRDDHYREVFISLACIPDATKRV